MVRSLPAARPASPRSLRERRIAALSTPVASAGDDAPRLRWTLDQRCAALGVPLTEAWRSLAQIFDETDAPLSVAEVWNRARTLDLKASRAHVNHLIKSLRALGVLIIADAGPPIRYATPLALRIGLLTRAGQDPLPIEDPWRSRPWPPPCDARASGWKVATSRSRWSSGRSKRPSTRWIRTESPPRARLSRHPPLLGRSRFRLGRFWCAVSHGWRRLARPAGFEPATARLEGECSIQLS